jgi:hypothetical protein
MARSGVADGEYHNAADATLDFLGDRDRIQSLRLHPHAEADEKATNGTEIKRQLGAA